MTAHGLIDTTEMYLRTIFELEEEGIGQKELAQINKALERIDHGTYGISEVSGKPIPLARLEAVPSATKLVGEEIV